MQDQPAPKLTVRNYIRHHSLLVQKAETEALPENWNAQGFLGFFCCPWCWPGRYNSRLQATLHATRYTLPTYPPGLHLHLHGLRLACINTAWLDMARVGGLEKIEFCTDPQQAGQRLAVFESQLGCHGHGESNTCSAAQWLPSPIRCWRYHSNCHCRCSRAACRRYSRGIPEAAGVPVTVALAKPPPSPSCQVGSRVESSRRVVSHQST